MIYQTVLKEVTSKLTRDKIIHVQGKWEPTKSMLI